VLESNKDLLQRSAAKIEASRQLCVATRESKTHTATLIMATRQVIADSRVQLVKMNNRKSNVYGWTW
jgi:hypothetical protein